MTDSNTENPQSSAVPPVERVRQEVDRWLEVVRATGERAMETLGLSGNNRSGSVLVDVIESAKDVVVQVELPGVAPESVELKLVGNMLTISGGRATPEFSAESRVHLRERVYGPYQRSIPLPASVDEDGIRASAHDGLLTVILPKAVSTPGRSIPVKTGS